MPELIPGYRYEVMSRAELMPYIKKHQAAIFIENGHLDASYALLETEKNALDSGKD